jgi:benzoyl-CoA-dihydrodiol lyase
MVLAFIGTARLCNPNLVPPDVIDFRTNPSRYRHWKLTLDPPVAYLSLDVDENAGFGDYQLKLNSYDLAVDIELADAVQRLRFEHPEVGAVVITSSKDRVFCAGANIGMLASADHALKVNFCKFTNETRLAIEDATTKSAQRYLAAINGNAAGGGYELALATAHIMLIDDGSAVVSLPEVPLLGVLPGTGGLTRLIDKRGVRRDHADILCTTEEGIKGRRALDWNLVDELVPRSRFRPTVEERARGAAADSDRPHQAAGIVLDDLEREIDGDSISYAHLEVAIDRTLSTASLTIKGPQETAPADIDALVRSGSLVWSLALCRQLDDAVCHLRVNEPSIGTFIFRSIGDPELVTSYDNFLLENIDNWLVREIILYWKRTLKRLDVTSRTLVSLIEPGSCFVGLLAELVLGSDRSLLLQTPEQATSIRLSPINTGPLPMGNGLTRLASRFWNQPDHLSAAEKRIGDDLDAATAEELGLITAALGPIDWEDEIRIFLEERAGFSPDSLTGMEANLRVPGPETMESKIFGRLSAWQNWVFYRPNASGPEGTLKLYGTGRRPKLDLRRT